MFPLLGLKGINHYWTYVYPFWGCWGRSSVSEPCSRSNSPRPGYFLRARASCTSRASCKCNRIESTMGPDGLTSCSIALGSFLLHQFGRVPIAKKSRRSTTMGHPFPVFPSIQKTQLFLGARPSLSLRGPWPIARISAGRRLGWLSLGVRRPSPGGGDDDATRSASTGRCSTV